jgi:hypothetical protein
MALAMPAERLPQRQPRRAASAPPERHLAVVPSAAKRSISYFAFALVGLFVLVSVVIGFQAYIAQQQLTLDHVTSELRLAKRYHDELRQVRAELIAPDYLREQAAIEGMTQGLGARFVEVPESAVAAVAISTGSMDPVIAEPSATSNPLRPLLVPAANGGQP